MDIKVYCGCVRFNGLALGARLEGIALEEIALEEIAFGRDCLGKDRIA